MYAYLDDGPYAGELVRIEPTAGGRPPPEIELADADGTPQTYELRGPHHDDERWIFRLVREDVPDAQDS